MKTSLPSFIAFFLILIIDFHASVAQDSPQNRPAARLAATTEEEPKASDEVFVATTGSGYDVYRFRKDVPNGRLRMSVDITRYYSPAMRFDAQGFLTNAPDLIKSGLLPRLARLTLRVYDVDHNSQYDGNDDDIADPEVDHVYLNGRLVRTSSGAVWTLGSGNNTWSTPSILVPIEMLKFPTQPGTAQTRPRAENIVEIDIDVPNTTVWAVECDWVSVQIEGPMKPIVFVRGYGLSNSGTPEGTWGTFMGFTRQDGIPVHLATSIGSCSSIFENAGRLATEIQTARNTFGVDKVNVVAHSKGGLDTRAYLRSNGDVQNLVQLATPNHGSGVAYIPGTGFRCEAGDNLEPSWLANNFNYLNEQKDFPLFTNELEKETRFFLLIATDDEVVSPQRATVPWKALYPKYFDRFGNLMYEDLTKPTNVVNNGAFTFPNIFTDHSDIHESVAVYRRSISLITDSKVTAQGQKGGRTAAPSENQATEGLTDTLSVVLAQNATLKLNTSQTLRAYLPNEGIGYFQGLFLQDKGKMVLKSPSGTVYTSNSTGYSQGMIPSGFLTVYQIPKAEKGYWEITMNAGAVENTYALKVYGESDRKVVIGTNKYNYATREPVIVNVNYTSKNQPIIRGTGKVYFYSSAKQDSIQLFDDGLHQDQKANDGIYGNQYGGFEQTGMVTMVTKLKEGAEETYDESTVNVIAKTAEFTNVFSESTSDINSDGLIDTLHIRIGVRFNIAGNYLLTGVLKNAKGEVIATSAWRNPNTKPQDVGVANITLSFDGLSIGKNELNGPYTLENLALMDVSRSAIVDSRTKAYTTRNYNVRLFNRPPVILTNQKSESPVDSDKDGDFDFLDIKVQVNVSKAGTFDLSAELIDSLQNSLNWTETRLSLSQGLNVITLRFSGSEINEKLANGPYRLTNLYFSSSFASVTFYDVYQTQKYLFSQFNGIVISGRVTDQLTGLGIANATVLLKGAKLVTTQTDAQGKYTIAGLLNGNYTIEALITGYCNSKVTTLNNLRANTITDLVLVNKRIVLSKQKQFQVCFGDSLRLSPPGVWESYRWSNGNSNNTIYVKSSGKFSVAVFQAGCTLNSDTVEVQVIMIPKPTITSDGILTLSTTPSERYQWYKDDVLIQGANQQAFTATSSGRYTVNVFLNGCSRFSDPFSLIITSANPLRVAEVSLRTHPNPTYGKIKATVELPTPAHVTLQVVDNHGHGLLKWQSNAPQLTHEAELDLTNWAVGVYVVVAEVNGIRVSKKIIKN